MMDTQIVNKDESDVCPLRQRQQLPTTRSCRSRINVNNRENGKSYTASTKWRPEEDVSPSSDNNNRHNTISYTNDDDDGSSTSSSRSRSNNSPINNKWQWPTSIIILATTAIIMLSLVTTSSGETLWDQCGMCSCKWSSGKKTAECEAKGLTEIPRNLSTELQVINLSHNNIPEIRKNEFSDANLQNVHKLFLKNCTLQLLHRDSMRGLNILIELDLSDNQLRELPVGLFDPTVKLRTLVLNRNEIDVIDDHLFKNLPNLHKIELKHNRIHRIGVLAFENLPSLAQIYLDSNLLTTLKKETFDNLDKLTSLSIMQNRWNCTCDLEQFRDFIITRNLFFNPTCYEPRQLRDQSWTDLSADNFACRPRITRIKPGSRFRSTGENETLECEISASPRPEITWLFNKRPLHNHENRYRVRAIESYRKSGTDMFISKLTIIGMRASDKGTYTCVASNLGGKDEGHINLDRSVNGIFHSSSDAAADRSWFSSIYGIILLIFMFILIMLCVAVLLYCCCRRRLICTSDKKYKKNSSIISENGLIHSKLNDKQQNESMIEGGSVIMEMQKGLLTEVNPVEKPPRRTEMDANGTYQDIMDEKTEIKKTLLDETAFGSHDDETQSVALSDTMPRSRQTFVDDGSGTNLPPDLLAFPSRYAASPPNASMAGGQPSSLHNSIQNMADGYSLYGAHRSPMGSPIYSGTMSHQGMASGIYGTMAGGNKQGFRTLPHQRYGSQTLTNGPMRVANNPQSAAPVSRTQSPFTPGPILYQPLLMKQGYVTIPRKPRTPSWAPSIASTTTTNTTNLDSLQLMAHMNNNWMSSPAPTSPVSILSGGGVVGSEFAEPVYDNLGLRTTASGNSVLNIHKLSAAKNNNYSMKDRPLPATPGQQVPVGMAAAAEPLYDMNRVKKVPPQPPPKPQKRQMAVTSSATGDGNVSSQLYQDEGDDGTEV